MDEIGIRIGDDQFQARLRTDLAPATCTRFLKLLPLRQTLIHARWSGEACWIPLGSLDLDVPLESPTGDPGPGTLLFYPCGISETEILLPYGEARFAYCGGDLVGTPFLTISDDLDRLAQVGTAILWSGARPITFSS